MDIFTIFLWKYYRSNKCHIYVYYEKMIYLYRWSFTHREISMPYYATNSNRSMNKLFYWNLSILFHRYYLSIKLDKSIHDLSLYWNHKNQIPVSLRHCVYDHHLGKIILIINCIKIEKISYQSVLTSFFVEVT